MNPQQQDNIPAFELPPAQTGEQSHDASQERQQDTHTETEASIAVEHNVSQPDPSLAQQQVSSAIQGTATDDVPASAVAPQTHKSILGGVVSWVPQIADDTDLIEKEWVEKAKEIVAQTAHDPHLQSREMNKFKAEYMRKRYNKELKLSDDS